MEKKKLLRSELDEQRVILKKQKLTDLLKSGLEE